MEAEVLGFVTAILAAVRGFIAVVQKETVALLTSVGLFLAGLAIAVGDIKF